tara:strand:+ start:1502 stop:2407 length:906 start_codon:yes stop_codon:yes gene_type:complete
MQRGKVMTKQEYYDLMRGQGLTNKYVIEPMWEQYKRTNSRQLASSQTSSLMQQNQNRAPVQVKPTREQALQAQATLQAIADKMKAAGGFKLKPDGGDILNPPKRHLPPFSHTKPKTTPDTKTTPPGHRTHLPNPNAPKSAAPHSHTGAPSIGQKGKPNTPPQSEEDLHKGAKHTNPPASQYTPSKSLPVAPVKKPLANNNYMDENLYIGIQRTQGRMATHANYLQYLRNHGAQLADTTPHISTQIQVHQNAKGTQSLQKGHSDDEYAQGYTQITADQLRAQLNLKDPTGMSVPDTGISSTI